MGSCLQSKRIAQHSLESSCSCSCSCRCCCRRCCLSYSPYMSHQPPRSAMKGSPALLSFFFVVVFGTIFFRIGLCVFIIFLIAFLFFLRLPPACATKAIFTDRCHNLHGGRHRRCFRKIDGYTALAQWLVS
mmetsp:Transcript_6648/g.18051  ORF Transcript_6648/g.18051 Transcript_6648/m.18051 type:complete len:131 (-) Transcript_6648:141-533(-)